MILPTFPKKKEEDNMSPQKKVFSRGFISIFVAPYRFFILQILCDVVRADTYRQWILLPVQFSIMPLVAGD